MTTQNQENLNELEKKDQEIGRLSMKRDLNQAIEKADWITEPEKLKFKKFIFSLE